MSLSTAAAGTIPILISGYLPGPPMRLLPDRVTRQSGLAVKWSSGAEVPATACRIPAGDTACHPVNLLLLRHRRLARADVQLLTQTTAALGRYGRRSLMPRPAIQSLSLRALVPLL